jgi:hypothetical protein
MPARYQWTRRGYVYVEGYWDYNVARRGVVFAPVRFTGDAYSRPDYYYTPATVIAVNVFLNHLFVRPHYGQYYFGDYYAPRYRNEGFIASFDYHSDRHGYDPIYAHSRWEHRDDRDWDRKRRDDFNFYRDNENARPPQTYAALRARADGDRRGQRDNFEFAQPLNRYVENRDNGPRFQAVDEKQRNRIVEQRQELRKFGDDRQRFENRDAAPKSAEGKGDGKDTAPAQAIREKFARSPLAGKLPAQLTGRDVPPAPQQLRDPQNSDRNGNGKGNPDARPGQPSQPGQPGGPPKTAGRDDRPGRNPTSEPGTPNVPRQGDNSQPGATTQPGRHGKPQVNPTPQPPATTPGATGTPSTPTQPKATPAPGNPQAGGRNRGPGEKPRNPDAAPARRPEADPQPAPQKRSEPAAPTPTPAPTRRATPEADRPKTAPEPQQQRPAQPKAAPQPQARPAPQPQARQAPQPQPTRPAPQPQQARPAPQPQQARPQPKAAPAPAPQAAPKAAQPAGKPEGGRGRKDKD